MGIKAADTRSCQRDDIGDTCLRVALQDEDLARRCQQDGSGRRAAVGVGPLRVAGRRHLLLAGRTPVGGTALGCHRMGHPIPAFSKGARHRAVGRVAHVLHRIPPTPANREGAVVMGDDQAAAVGSPAEAGMAAPAPGRHAPDRNLALELARVTEAGAMASARWVGRGDKNGADGAAVNAMRQLISTVSMNGIVVIGEGEKDKAPMLYNGEQVGDGSGALCDVAVDPIDGTRLTANGMPNAISVIAVSARGSMYDPSAVYYMSKLVTGPEAASVVDLDAPPAANISAVARAKSCSPSDVTVVILDRPRHGELIREGREAGATIKLLTDGDVAGAIMAAREGTGIDLLLGIGGTPEGISAALAVQCPGGLILGKLA